MTILLIFAGLTALYVGGELLVRGAEGLGRRAGISSLVLGLTVVAFGTSAPELAVSLDAALTGLADIAITNVIGSNIANIALVGALIASFRAIASERNLLRRDIPVMLASLIAISLFLADRNIGRHEGVALLAALAVYSIALYLSHRREAARTERTLATGETRDHSRPGWTGLTLKVAVGAIVLTAGGDLLVEGATELAADFGVSEALIGLTVVAVGTSLPEIAASLVAARRGQVGMAIGNVVGSNIWNTLGVLGITSVTAPLTAQTMEAHMVFSMIAAGLMLWVFAATDRQISRFEGRVMLVSFVAYFGWAIVG
jgi:cation:H+ antiporter